MSHPQPESARAWAAGPSWESWVIGPCISELICDQWLGPHGDLAQLFLFCSREGFMLLFK